jgi:chromosome segregation ATPase
MSQAAGVDSIEKLKEFRVALCLFIDAVGKALNEAEAEIQRTTIWLRHDQNSYWKAQITRRREQFSQAKNALNAKKLTRTPLGGRYSVVDEEQAVAITKQRLEEAERKLANVQRWARFFEDEVLDYKGQTQSLARSAEAELPGAIAQLDRMITALESYVALSVPEAQQVMADVLS